MINLTSAFAVALPLYIWPSKNAWTPFYNTISTNPHTTFNIIINPNSGPGAFPPDPSYITSIATLNNYTNTNLYGYIHTLYASRSLASLESDISTYAHWQNYTSANLSLSGIFVDEAPWSTENLTYMADLSQLIHTTLPLPKTSPYNNPQIWTNPGCAIDPAFYEHADMVNAFEDTCAAWSCDGGASEIPEDLRSRSSVMILDFEADVAGQVEELREAGYASALLNGGDDYQVYDATWGRFADDV